MKRAVFVLAAWAAASSVAAEPMGVWWSGFGQGTFEYGIKNDSAGSDSVYIACSDDSTTISFTVGGEDPKPAQSVVVTIGGDEFEVWTDQLGRGGTASHASADTFTALWAAMRKGDVMRVRLASGRSTAFTLKGAAKALPKEPCTPDFYR
ncbi:hypothetical protein [Caulobacter sp. 17J65-9]|uniref:hypothetical protein n=1 Tax=Caulobacter sp. 17J65-9 TaxID=2709382 RepID=UPI0013C5B5B9|nr:hypothetical protein [Caulobacter sp. 17J65-9]NEX91177.1 hypothetical protein [Caulobacter sp. 17J65-9]